MRFFMMILMVSVLSPNAFSDDFYNQAIGGFGNDNNSHDESTEPSTFWKDLFSGKTKEEREAEGLQHGETIETMSPERLNRVRKNFRKKYDPTGIVPDKCITRNSSFVMKKDGYAPKIKKLGRSGYASFLRNMEYRGRGDRSRAQRKRYKRQMLPCTDRPDRVAKKVNIIVDKAGKAHRQDRGRKQSMSIYITYANGDKEKWEGLPISTGSSHFGIADPSSGPSVTPTGTFHLNHFATRADGSFGFPDSIEKTQAYCVQGRNDSNAFAMPNATKIACGYYFHSGQYNGVTGGPRSHGCVRMNFDHSRKLYCLMRQRGPEGSGDYENTNHRRTTVHVVPDLKRMNPEDIEVAKWNTQVVPRPKDFVRPNCKGRMERPLVLNPTQQ